MKVAHVWAEGQLEIKAPQKSPKPTEEHELLAQVRRLRDLCQQYEYAEQGRGEDLLVTEPLKNLATNFRDELPHVVSIGAKGAGKTFNYIQLSRFKYWESFLNRIDNRNHADLPKTHIFPLLESSNVKDNAKTVINAARNQVRRALGDDVTEFLPLEYADRIKRAIANPHWTLK